MKSFARSLGHGGAALALAFLAGCDLPTSAPIIQSTWIVPVTTDRIAVRELLPSGVIVDGDVFVVGASSATTRASLGGLCGACVPFDGTTIPKPAFQSTMTTQMSLADDLVRAVAGADARIVVRLANGLGFDPIRPSATERGQIVITVRADGEVVTADTVLGAALALPSGGDLDRTLTLAAGTELSGTLTIAVEVESPLGDPVEIDVDRQFTVTSEPLRLAATSAEVVVRNRTVTSGSTEITFNDLDDGITDRTTGATVELQLTNPLAIAGELSVRFRGPGGDLVSPRTVPLVEGSSTPTIELSEAEIQAVLGSSAATVVVEGVVSGTAAGEAVTVEPDDAVQLRARVALHTHIGE